MQVGGKIEVDGSDQRDGDKDGKLSQFLKQHRALNPSLARSRSRLLFLGLLSKNKILQILSLRFVVVEREFGPMLGLDWRRRKRGWWQGGWRLGFNMFGIAGDKTKDPIRTGGFISRASSLYIVASSKYSSPPAQAEAEVAKSPDDN